MKKPATALALSVILIVYCIAIPVLAARKPSENLTRYEDVFKRALEEAEKEVDASEAAAANVEDVEEAQEEARGSVESVQAQMKGNAPVSIILDMDMSTDVDDVAAVRIAEEMDHQGLCKIIGFAFCSMNPSGNATKAAEGILDFAGLTDVPVAKAATSYDYGGTGDYWGSLWQHKTTNHQIYDNAVNMYKDLLKNSSSKVRIVTTGFLTNIEALLRDSEGYELVKNKVDSIYIAGGEYDGLCYNLSYDSTRVGATDYVTRNSPVPLYFTMDVLGAIRVGGHLTQMDKDDRDILSQAFKMFGLADGTNYGNCDGTAVYCAVTQDTSYGGYFEAIPCNFEINTKNGGVIKQTTAVRDTGIYMLEATYTKDKYELYASARYTSLFDSYLEADYLRKHP